MCATVNEGLAKLSPLGVMKGSDLVEARTSISCYNPLIRSEQYTVFPCKAMMDWARTGARVCLENKRLMKDT